MWPGAGTISTGGSFLGSKLTLGSILRELTGLSLTSGSVGPMTPYSRQTGSPLPLKVGHCRETAFGADGGVGWGMVGGQRVAVL